MSGIFRLIALIIIVVLMPCEGFCQAASNESTNREILELQDKIKEIGSRLDKLSQGLSTSNPAAAPFQPTAPSGSTANSYPTQSCPVGYYAAGIQAWGSPGSTRYCIGCLTGVALICKQFPASQ
jgi:hypothetical protein